MRFTPFGARQFLTVNDLKLADFFKQKLAQIIKNSWTKIITII
jgi:hypothetical protein